MQGERTFINVRFIAGEEITLELRGQREQHVTEKRCNAPPEQKNPHLNHCLTDHFYMYSSHSVKKLEPVLSTSALCFVLMSKSAQSVTDLNRMFFNTLLMIC